MMKIKRESDAIALENKIKEDLGIDLRKYRSEESAEALVNLLLFPKYVIAGMIRPLIVSFLLYVIGFFLIDLVHIEYIIYAIVGFVLFIINGFFAGLLILNWRIKRDIWGILDYSFGVMKSVAKDVEHLGAKTNKKNLKETMSMLFVGVIHIVTLPVLRKVIKKKIPLIHGIINGIIKRLLVMVANKVKFDKAEEIEDSIPDGNEPLQKTKTSLVQRYIRVIEYTSDKIELVISYSFKVATFPTKLIMGFTMALLVLFIYLIY